MSQTPINFSDTTPAAPAGKTNVKWQTDGSGNTSAYYTPGSGSSGAPSGTIHGFGGQSPLGALGPAYGTVFNWYPNQAGGTFTQNSTTAGANPTNYKLLAAVTYCFLGDYFEQITPDILQQIQYYAAAGQTTSCRMWLGCAAGQGATLEATDPACAMIALRFDSSVDTNWQAYVSNSGGGAHTAVDTGVAPDTNFHQFKIAADGSGGLNYYIDGSLVANIPSGSTGFPTGSTPLATAMQVDSSGTAFILVNSMQWWSVL